MCCHGYSAEVECERCPGFPDPSWIQTEPLISVERSDMISANFRYLTVIAAATDRLQRCPEAGTSSSRKNSPTVEIFCVFQLIACCLQCFI